MKALLRGKLRHDLVDSLFEGGGWRHVDHPPTTGAEKMMVVLGQILGKLESRELVARRNAPDHSGALEINEMPVRRAPRHVR